LRHLFFEMLPPRQQLAYTTTAHQSG